MERYFSKRKQPENATETPTQESREMPTIQPLQDINIAHEIELPTDPAKRRSIYAFAANEKDRPACGGQSGGDSFVSEGFTNWRLGLKRLREHVGDHNSIHNKCRKVAQDLMNQKQHIEVVLSREIEQSCLDYRTRLDATIDVIRLCLSQGLAFRGHDETENSLKRVNFLTILEFLAKHNEEVKKVMLDHALGNNKLIAPNIQNDIMNAVTIDTTNIILKDLGDKLFSILVDESRDISIKEQMVLLIRYVDKYGSVAERFLGVVHVNDTTSLSLKHDVELSNKHRLSIAKIRGQGYDGASNMQGKFNGLNILILKDNPCAYYIHCFAHQLQLALIGVVKNDRKIAVFFTQISTLTNVVYGSCKRQDLLRDKQTEEVLQGICLGEIMTGKGFNQEANLKRAGDTRWGFYYMTLLSLIRLWSPVDNVLEHVAEHTDDHKLRGNAELMLVSMNNFDFVFYLHLLKNILEVSNELSQALQKNE
ncbi:uncharacterized protein LOC108219719 [Daucus carota subsp. sativus]|uniref:uncharacterized protein LOC108219719 n=1 Tax=Daucus carota subsp. sativus TaxID=79200 RepID=UPI0007F03260|nr:PREDICTED: zinc finger MYM-type protein 1-like [Daucus carota subsp. sativus]